MWRIGLIGVGVWVLAFLLWNVQLRAQYPSEFLPASPLTGSSSDAQIVSGIGDFSSAHDFYYYQGKKISLQRSLTEVAIQFKPDIGHATEQQVMQALSVPEASVRKIQVAGHELIIVKLSDSQPQPQSDSSVSTLRIQQEVEFAFPVLLNPETGTHLFLTDEIVIKMKSGLQVRDVIDAFPAFGLAIVQTMWGTEDEYLVRVQNPKAVNPLAVANSLVESGLVEWAEPNFLQEYYHSFTPNDPLYPSQWHLNNTGQQGGSKPGADVKAPEAWNLEQGNANIIIAILDDGVETTHEDLAANIFTNPGEIAGNGLDDDGNGLIDDVQGWDFANNDNNPNPSSPNDKHGTAVAGVAAARGNNAFGVSGACPQCKILPIKISNPDSEGKWVTPDFIQANVIRYAARLADVLNGSWGGGSPSSVVQSALQYATTVGREGKGTVALFASGNSASGFKLMGPLPLPAGTHRFRWVYTKNGLDVFPAGADTAWIGWVLFPGLQGVNFETSPGWITGGNAPWSISYDPTHADESLCFTHAAKVGTITHNQSSSLQVVRTVPAGTIAFAYWVESEKDFDGLKLEVDLNNDGSDDLSTSLLSGQPSVNFNVSYPAAYPEAIAVGASSNLDCRSYYSQFGPELDFVVPSGGILKVVFILPTGPGSMDTTQAATIQTASAAPLRPPLLPRGWPR